MVTIEGADVYIEKEASQATAADGATVTYTLTYGNNGPLDAANTVITETYPAGFTFVSATPAPDTGTDNVWSLGTLADDATGTITIQGTVTGTPGTVFVNYTEIETDT